MIFYFISIGLQFGLDLRKRKKEGFICIQVCGYVSRFTRENQIRNITLCYVVFFVPMWYLFRKFKDINIQSEMVLSIRHEELNIVVDPSNLIKCSSYNIFILLV